MPATKIADVVVPDVFNPYVIERTSELALFYLGGIVSTSSELDRLATAGGKLINMPFWQDLTGADEVLSDATPLTVNPITSDTDIAALHTRGKAWGVNDLAKALSGDDPMMAIADLVSNFWVRRYVQLLTASLDGVISDNIVSNAGDMVIDVAIEDGTAAAPTNLFSGDVFIDGQATFGDAIGGLSGIAFHPVVYHNLKKLDNISFIRESEGSLEIEFYRGLRVIVDRNMPVVAGGISGFKYTSYLFGAGAVGLGQGSAPVPSETDRDSLAGEDILVSRNHFILHPRGVKFNSASVAGTTPTNTEVKLAANWTRVYERENVRVAAIITNG